MRTVIVAIAACALAACYDPVLRDCTIACASGDACAPGQVCGDDGFCAAPAVAGHCSEVLRPDARASSKPDAKPAAIDARASLCALGCTNGTCDGDVCVIDCSAAGSCPTDVHCPANLPCRVVCGDNACKGHVDCTKASACDIRCTGDQSCANEVDCGPGACDVTCSGASSCHAKTKCHGSCACDVACTGLSSCMGGADCPEDCQLGLGCTSQLASCDKCP